MSGYPSTSQVKELRERVVQQTRMRDEAALIRKTIKQQQTRLAELEQGYGLLNSQILKQLEEMDVRQTANAGWEGRMIEFLAELVMQAEQHGADNAPRGEAVR